MKRKEQNRAAQRAFRERKEKQEVSRLWSPLITLNRSLIDCPLWPSPRRRLLPFLALIVLAVVQREQRRKELLEKEKAAAELKKLEDAEATRKATEAALLLLDPATMPVLPSPVGLPMELPLATPVPEVNKEQEAGGDGHGAIQLPDDDASSEDELDDAQPHIEPPSWVSVGQGMD